MIRVNHHKSQPGSRRFSKKLRQRRCFPFRFVILAVLVACTAVPAGAKEKGHLWHARTLLGEARDLRDSVQTAQEQGNAELAQKRAASMQTKLDESLVLFEQAEAGSSADLGILIDYAAAFRLHGDSDLAAEVLEQAVERYPKSGLAWLRLAQNYVEMGGESYRLRSQDAFQQALEQELDPALRVAAHEGLGAFYYKEGLYEFARQHHEKALELDSSHLPSQIALATLALRRGNVLKASNILDAIGMVPGEFKSQLNEQLNKAVDTFERRRRWFPDEAEHHVAYAKLLIRADRVSQVRLPLERAVTLNPDNYVYWNLLASACRFRGNTDRAIEAYEESLQLNGAQQRVRQMLERLSGSEAAKPGKTEEGS